MIDIGILCHPTNVQMAWPQIVELVEAHGQDWLEIVDLNDVFCKALKTELEIWLGTKGSELELAAFCSWEWHAKKSFYRINYLCGKNIDAYLKDGLKKMEQYACFRGATELQLGGRPGWERALAGLGYGRRSVELGKNVRILSN